MPRRNVLLALVLTPAASAGTLSVSGTTITYQAAPGEENFLTVNWGNVAAEPSFIPVLSDHVDVTPLGSCEEDASGFRCPSAGPNPVFVVRLGDGNDFAQSINDHAAGHHVELYGEDGDDDLDSDASSDLLDGVFFDSGSGETTFERSRRFRVARADPAELRAIAGRVAARFHQSAVLTFDDLRPGDPAADAVELEVPGVSADDLRAGLLADREAAEKLFGGSVTLDRVASKY